MKNKFPEINSVVHYITFRLHLFSMIFVSNVQLHTHLIFFSVECTSAVEYQLKVLTCEPISEDDDSKLISRYII